MVTLEYFMSYQIARRIHIYIIYIHLNPCNPPPPPPPPRPPPPPITQRWSDYNIMVCSLSKQD